VVCYEYEITNWKVRRSNSGGCKIFRIRPDRSWGPPILLYNGQWVNWHGVALTTHSHLTMMLKKDKIYTSTAPLGLHGLF
jgi:hypothetical protein